MFFQVGTLVAWSAALIYLLILARRLSEQKRPLPHKVAIFMAIGAVLLRTVWSLNPKAPHLNVFSELDLFGDLLRNAASAKPSWCKLAPGQAQRKEPSSMKRRSGDCVCGNHTH